MLSKWIDHIKSHYVDKDLVKKGRVARDIIYLNYDSVVQIIPLILLARGIRGRTKILAVIVIVI
jgi:hypothetical protein